VKILHRFVGSIQQYSKKALRPTATARTITHNIWRSSAFEAKQAFNELIPVTEPTLWSAELPFSRQFAIT
jgi:hypothetical protein